MSPTAVDFRPEESLDRIGGEVELLVMLVETWIRESANYLEGLRNARQGTCLESIKQASHKIKGASATIGMECVRSKALLIETGSKNHEELDVLRGQINDLIDHLELQALPYLKEWVKSQQ